MTMRKSSEKRLALVLVAVLFLLNILACADAPAAGGLQPVQETSAQQPAPTATPERPTPEVKASRQCGEEISLSVTDGRKPEGLALLRPGVLRVVNDDRLYYSYQLGTWAEHGLWTSSYGVIWFDLRVDSVDGETFCVSVKNPRYQK